jgi:hypothetical protein
MSLLHLDIHMLHPGQLRIQDYPKILDQHRKLHSYLKKKKKGSKKLGSFLFFVTTTSSVLSGFTNKPISPHQVSTV